LIGREGQVWAEAVPTAINDAMTAANAAFQIFMKCLLLEWCC
jgi:hypothetical protein